MMSPDETLSRQFYQWEQRTRGWRVHPQPVCLEPAFVPFPGYHLPRVEDDGRKPTFVSQLWERLNSSPSTVEESPPEDEPEPSPLVRKESVELAVSLAADANPAREAMAQALPALAYCREPLAFEIIGTEREIVAQFAASHADSDTLHRQLSAHHPEASFLSGQGRLHSLWEDSGDETAVVEFGLERETVLSLATGRLDPYVGLVGAMSGLQPGELALFQVLFQAAHAPWQESLVRSLLLPDGKPIFVNQPELAEAVESKVSQPLYAVVVRVAAKAADFDRAWQVAREVALSLRSYAHPGGNELIPLVNNGYPHDAHRTDVLLRQSRRSGMILTRDELLALVHLPSAAVRSPRFKRQVRKSKAASSSQGTLSLGLNHHAGVSQEVFLSPELRARHVHLIGASGTGKSTLLFNLIQQDIQNGEGLAVLDPHGDLIDRILGIIPEHRISDVVLIDPADETASIGFNILSAHSDLEKNLLASDLVSVFRRLSTSWGDQMGSVLQNAVLAFLENERGGTLADLRRFLIEPGFREQCLAHVHDPEIIYYWRKAFPQLGGNRSIGPILTRLDTFLAPKPIRYMVSQPTNRLDFAAMMDGGKIVLAKLSQGQLGRENAFLLGSLLVAKFQQLAMGRQSQEAGSRRPFTLFIDEFQNFITPSMTEILSGARKYRLGLVLAHQELRQLERDREVASAVLSNCGTRVVFRVGDEDARKLAEGLASFEARDLQTLETGEAICRIERADHDFNLTVPLPVAPDPAGAQARSMAVIETSRRTYATPRAEIEAALQTIREPEPVPQAAERKPAEARKATGSEKESMLPEARPVVVEPEPPADLGRGGEEHKAIQRRLKEAAAELGWLATIEKPVLQGQGSVDLTLEREGECIAVEVAITTSIDHEVGNVAKCLKAGCPAVAVICLSEERLQRIRMAVEASLGAKAAGVGYFLPDQFIAYLQALPPQAAEVSDAPKIRRGYKVKHQLAKLSPEERRHRETAAIQSIKDIMRRKVKT
jgi:hypothetical protein